jgi:CheY-like chemotaxis protein
VAVTSAPGAGTTYTLRFPARMRVEAAPARALPGSPEGRGHQRLVLLVDDEESARDLTTRALTRLGVEVRTAGAGGEGVEMARLLKPSLVLLDINLPDMTGWDVLDLLLTVDAGDTPVIVHSIDDDRQRALAAGACEHLVKPADRDVLAAAALRFARAPELIQPAAAPVISMKTKTA